MSATDFRRLIDLRDGTYIGVECTDGSTIEIGVDGDTLIRADTTVIRERIMPRIRERMDIMQHDGFAAFLLNINGRSINLTYYDAGMLLDTLGDVIRYLN